MTLASRLGDVVAAIGADVKALYAAVAGKQDTLVSATNIKTINGASVLGAGNLVVTGAAGPSPVVIAMIFGG